MTNSKREEVPSSVSNLLFGYGSSTEGNRFIKPEDIETLQFDWGRIKWLSTPKVTGSERLSAGIVQLVPKEGHEQHNHPDNEEILHVISGEGIQTIDGQSDALAHLESPDTRIEIHHDSIGSLSFHEPLGSTDRPTHPLFARYADALTDYSNTLETHTGDSHDPVLYSGRPDLVIELYDTTSDDQLVAVLLGEVKYSNTKQTFKQGLEELVMYRQFADHDGYLIDTPDVTVTSLLITNGFTTGGTSDTVVHLNGTDLLTPSSDHQHPPDWIRPLVGPIWNRPVTSES